MGFFPGENGTLCQKKCHKDCSSSEYLAGPDNEWKRGGEKDNWVKCQHSAVGKKLDTICFLFGDPNDCKMKTFFVSVVIMV